MLIPIEQRSNYDEFNHLCDKNEAKVEMLRAYADQLVLDYVNLYDAFLIIEDQDTGINLDNKMRWDDDRKHFYSDIVIFLGR